MARPKAEGRARAEMVIHLAEAEADYVAYAVKVSVRLQNQTEIASTEYEDYRHYWKDEVPMRRYGSVDEVAPIALLLASDASSFVTGSVYVVDGGYTLW